MMNTEMPISLRRYRADDAAGCLSLFRECVHRVNSRDYTPEQIAAWAPDNIDFSAWATRFDKRIAFVAVIGEHIVGFTDMTQHGHVDRLFVSADHQRRGIARRFIEALCAQAAASGIDQLTTDASITARPFFERMQFVVVQEQSVVCRGVRLTNYSMRRSFDRVQAIDREAL